MTSSNENPQHLFFVKNDQSFTLDIILAYLNCKQDGGYTLSFINKGTESLEVFVVNKVDPERLTLYGEVRFFAKNKDGADVVIVYFVRLQQGEVLKV